jgi:hypothetical protein
MGRNEPRKVRKMTEGEDASEISVMNRYKECKELDESETEGE